MCINKQYVAHTWTRPTGVAAAWLQNRLDYHTHFNTSMRTVTESSTTAFPPTTHIIDIRWTCNDIYQQWYGCNGACAAAVVFVWVTVRKPSCAGDYGVHNIRSTTQQVALVPPNTIPGQGNLTLCGCDDINASWCHRGDRRRNFPYNITTIETRQKEAAFLLQQKTIKTFNESGIPDIIKSLRIIAQEGMPAASFQNFQTEFYPLSKCSLQPTPAGLEQARKRGMM